MSVEDHAWARDVEPKPVEYLWRNRIPRGMISVVGGRPDQGKGLFMAHLAAEVTRQGENVLISAQEDPAEFMIRPRLEAAGADLDRVLLWNFVLPTQFAELCQHIRDNEIRLLVMDPFGAHLSGVSRNSDAIRGVLTPMRKLAERADVAIVIVDHVRKRVTRNTDPLEAILGSGSGLPAATRAAFLFGVHPDDPDERVLAPVKFNNNERPKSFAFEIDVDEFDVVGTVPFLIPRGEVEVDPIRLLVSGEARVGRRPDKRAAAAEWLTNYLANAGRPVKAGTVLEDAGQYGFSVKTVRRAADDMNVVRRPPGGGRNCTWELPAEVLEAYGLAADGDDAGEDDFDRELEDLLGDDDG